MEVEVRYFIILHPLTDSGDVDFGLTLKKRKKSYSFTEQGSRTLSMIKWKLDFCLTSSEANSFLNHQRPKNQYAGFTDLWSLFTLN